MAASTINIHTQPIATSHLSAVDFNNLEFGKYVSDHMVMIDYAHGAWGDAQIIPYGDLKMSPAMLSIHYGQSVFEGMKAFYMNDGAITIFRPYKHHERFQKSLERMCMPLIPENLFIESMHALLELDKNWVPKTDGCSLYIRPVMFATEAKLGVKIAEQYKFVIMTTPVAAYMSKPYRLKVEQYYVRTTEGGTGFAKCAGNYGGAFYPTQLAKQEGFDQVLWTDHKEHKYIDEVGMMNVMFIIDGKLVTPKLNEAILDGITRDSIITLAKDMGIEVVERKISVDELESDIKTGRLTEMFGAGTAAVVAPIALLNIHGTNYDIPVAGPESFQLKVKQLLTDIRKGSLPDKHNWNYIIR
jgi:branched-chain amino acid aminotransferase